MDEAIIGRKLPISKKVAPVIFWVNKAISMYPG
jgi:hypothetical protein